MVLTQRGIAGIKSVLLGFHTTMVLTQRDGFIKASIIDACFHTTMVLTQRAHEQQSWIVCIGVSIPLWFSRNDDGRAFGIVFQWFPYHYGSHATKVRIQGFALRDGFPYHYGSHATVIMAREYVFDSRFHTTMVLTQRPTRFKGWFLRSQFPYHYGSHATHMDAKTETRLRSFHTTMVLTQQLLLQKLYTIGGGKVKSIVFVCWEDIQSKDKGVFGFWDTILRAWSYPLKPGFL